MKMSEQLEKLHRLRARNRAMGGEEKLAKQRARGKLDVRARLALLFDEGRFTEVGLLTNRPGGYEDAADYGPADGVVCGYGPVNGRTVCVAAYDFTVYGGSMGPHGERKVTRMRELALRNRVPMVWLIDSGGARIRPQEERKPDDLSLFAESGYLFREESIMSGVVPLVAAMVGPGAAGTAYIPGLADFVPMVKGTSSIAIGGPYLTKSTVGEDISEEDLGGSKIHTKISGVADLETRSDQECIAAVREYLGFFPSHCMEKPARAAAVPPPDGAADALRAILPEETRRAYDMRKLLPWLVDGGKLFEIKPAWAKNVVCALARIDGWAVGLVANNPMYLGGILDVDSADKAARFVNLCDAFQIPLVFLQDVPGFMVGSKVEQQGIIRHGAKMIYAVANATVPKLTVVVRKGYGAGYYAMCGRAYEPDLLVSWPTSEISVMGPEGMVSIFMKKMLDASPDPEAMKKQVADAIRPYIDPFRVAGQALVDDVIDPAETRAVLAAALELTRNKTVERPPRRREVAPV
jgi:acetyl-CoA carboxylase carboxyltransferase component